MDAIKKILAVFRARKRHGLPMSCGVKRKASAAAPKKKHPKKSKAKPKAKAKKAKPSAREHFIRSQMSKGRTEAQAVAAWKLTHRRKH